MRTNHFARSLPLPAAVGYGVVVGAVGGLGAWAFRPMNGLVHDLLFLGRADVTYDANVHNAASLWEPWVIVVPILGAIGVVFLVRRFAPEAKGHGVPEMMEGIHYQSG